MVSKLKWTDSLAAKLLVKVFQYYIFVTIIVTIAHMMMDFSFTKDVIEEDLKVFHTSFEPGLSVALWNQEEEALQASLQAIYHVPQIEGAKIVDENGVFVTAIGRVITESGAIESYNPTTRSLDGFTQNSTDNSVQSLFFYANNIYHLEDGTNYHVGQLILYSSDSIVFSQVQYGYLFIIINSIIKTAALWLIVLWQSKPLIYEPLKKIAEKLKSQDPDSLKVLTFEIEKTENSELLLLKTSLNKIFNMLSLSFEERDRALAVVNMRNEELSQFSYRTSHDLKAPLVTVRGLSNAIIEDVDDGDYDEVKKNAIKIGEFVKKLEDLVTDILNLARADLEVSEKEHVDFNEVVVQIKERLAGTYINSEVKIDVDIDPSVSLYISKTRISQVLENLVSNSIKYRYNNKSAQFVKISIASRDDSIIVTVEDNGIGIPLKFQENVFSMFQRFHPHISYGSGLGMYIVKKHLDSMSAEINLVSSNNGTCIEMAFLND